MMPCVVGATGAEAVEKSHQPFVRAFAGEPEPCTHELCRRLGDSRVGWSDDLSVMADISTTDVLALQTT